MIFVCPHCEEDLDVDIPGPVYGALSPRQKDALDAVYDDHERTHP